MNTLILKPPEANPNNNNRHVILSISDGLFTLHLIERGATEENPVMAWFLSHGPWPFMIAKFILSSSAVIILLVFNNVYFRPLRIRVKTLIPVCAASSSPTCSGSSSWKDC
jgi:hypothetical protein